ncbi:MAG: FGGY-family carbohydrate kinase [Syntrophothermus sp.]
MSKSYLLGIDIGTYSSKGVLVQSDGKIIVSHSISHEMQMPRPGHFEQDADQVWWGDFVKIVRHLLETSQVDPRQIVAVGTSGIGPCVLPVDEQGNPLRPGILYGIDTRSSVEIAYLEKVLGREEIFRSCAMHLDSQAAGPKVLWIKNQEPNVFRRARWFLTSQAYLVYRLTGLPSIDVYTAGYFAPLYDVLRHEWNPSAAKHIAPMACLPPVYWSGEVVGRITEFAAKETGLATGTQVVAGTADAAAEAVSAGVSHDGDMLMMFGSSIFFILKTQRLVPSERFWSSNYLQAGTFAFAGGMSTAGSLTAWFRNQFAYREVESEKTIGINAYTSLAEAASSSPIGSHGLIALPYFEGERTPIHDPKARGMWFGLSLKHTRADLYRSLLESVAFGIRHNMEAMAEEGMQPQRILVSGGGAQNPLWMQIVADISGMDLVVPCQLAGACYGDAFIASLGVGLHQVLQEIENWVVPKTVIHSSAKNHAAYNRLYPIYRELYLNTRQQMHQLADLYSGENDDE